MENLLAEHRSELILLVLVALVLLTLLILVPQLLRTHLRKSEMIHLEQMKALDQGFPISREDDRSRVAGRTAMLVPMVIIICAGTVTCFLAAFKSEQLFTVVLAVWVVAGIVSLAAITGGVALIGRLAQLQSGELEEEEDPYPHNHLEER
jgi:hypothetical protein